MKDKISEICKIEKLRELKSQSKLRDLVQEEMKLRSSLSMLRSYRLSSHEADIDLIPLRTVRADVSWQSWISSSQETLNISLAKLLVQKSYFLQKARLDFARRQAVNEVAAQVARIDRVKIDEKFLNETVGSLVNRSAAVNKL